MSEPRTEFGSASGSVADFVKHAEAGDGPWFDGGDGFVSFVETDKSNWWTGTMYEVRFATPEMGWSPPGHAATYVMDIADGEDLSPNSSSPWSGWVGWYGEKVVITWQNPEVGVQGVSEAERPFDLDEPPTDEQWAQLARLITATCFES